jgi:hypothetical protein
VVIGGGEAAVAAVGGATACFPRAGTRAEREWQMANRPWDRASFSNSFSCSFPSLGGQKKNKNKRKKMKAD